MTTEGIYQTQIQNNRESIKENIKILSQHGERLAAIEVCVKTLPDIQKELNNINEVLNDGLRDAVGRIESKMDNIEKGNAKFSNAIIGWLIRLSIAGLVGKEMYTGLIK